MTKLQKIRQRCLKEKAAMLLGKPLNQIVAVEEHPNELIGATVELKSGSMPWIHIPLETWIGEKLN